MNPRIHAVHMALGQAGVDLHDRTPGNALRSCNCPSSMREGALLGGALALPLAAPASLNEGLRSPVPSEDEPAGAGRS